MKLQRIQEEEKEKFICTCCDKEFIEIPFCFGSDFPDYYFSVPPEERDERIELESSLCVVDEKYFFHKGRFEIPVLNYHQNLVFDVWLSISKENFEIRIDDWDNPNRVNNDPYFGWLQNQIPTYDYSINIKAKAIEEDIEFIPRIEVWDEAHQLTYDQKNGISLEKALGIINFALEKTHL